MPPDDAAHGAHSAVGGHDHALARDADRRYLAAALALLVAFLVLEVVFALVARSLVLLADAGHMLSDVVALGAALWAMYLAAKPARGVWTFGFQRAEILSAAGNGVTLIVVAVLITVDAVQRLVHPPHVDGGIVLVIALVGVAVNLAATWTLARASRRSLNIEGAYRHILTDLYAFAGTVVAGVVVLTTGFARADGIASLVIVALMLWAGAGLLRDSGRVLLEGAPEDVSLDDVRDHILGLPGVQGVHDLHAWTVTSDAPALSAHVVVDAACFANGTAPQILDRLQHCLTGHFDVEHSTFQLEPEHHVAHETGAHP